MEMRTADGLGDGRDESMRVGCATLDVARKSLLSNLVSYRQLNCHSLMCVAVSGCDGACDVNSALHSLHRSGSLRSPPSSISFPSLPLSKKDNNVKEVAFWEPMSGAADSD